jgi:hypothetical protein
VTVSRYDPGSPIPGNAVWATTSMGWPHGGWFAGGMLIPNPGRDLLVGLMWDMTYRSGGEVKFNLSDASITPPGVPALFPQFASFTTGDHRLWTLGRYDFQQTPSAASASPTPRLTTETIQ